MQLILVSVHLNIYIRFVKLQNLHVFVECYRILNQKIHFENIHTIFFGIINFVFSNTGTIQSVCMAGIPIKVCVLKRA